MTNNFNFLYKYFTKENVSIDVAVFENQIQSHPEYPSLLSIVDTLDFFAIDNQVIKVEFSDLNLLPDRFIVLSNFDNSRAELCFIEKIGSSYFCASNDKTREISILDLKKYWGKIVLLLNVSKETMHSKPLKKRLNHNFFLINTISLFFFVICWEVQNNLSELLFYLFPFFGFFLSVVAQKNLFSIDVAFTNKLCKTSSSIDCEAVINSTKWKFLKFIGLTDLSIVFFTTQFIGFFVFLFAHDSANFFAIQKILIIASIPLLAFSIYYQKYIEKKWCRICLLICTVVLLEMVYLAIFKKEMAKLNLLSVSIFGFLYFSISVLWFYVKKILTYKNELQEFQIKANRFIRNYDIFKNTLLASKKLNFNENENGYILLGNHDAKIKIIIVTSPFCEYCVQIHILLLKILSKYKDEICCDVRFNLDTNRGDKNSLITYYDLIDTYNKEGQFAFVEKLNNLNTNISKLFIEDEKVSLNKILQEQFNWNQKHNIKFTPTLIIGSYLFPKQYDLKDFIYFFDDLIADENFLTNHSRPSAF